MKKAIDWFVLIIGVALAASGAWWMWTGWDFVQVERGWASLISGAVMLSGGLIVFALAWVAMRVSGLSGLAPRAAAIEHAEEFAAAPRPPLAGTAAFGAAAVATAAATAIAVKTVARDETHEETPDAPHEPQPPNPSAIRPPSLPSASELLKLGENRRAELDDQPVEETAERDHAAPAHEDLHEDLHEPERAWPKPPPLPPFVAVAEAPPPLPAEPEPEPEPEPAHVEPPPVPEPPPPPAAAIEPAPPPAAEGHLEAPVHDDWLEETQRSLDRELGRAALPKESGDADDKTEVQPPKPAPEPAVVGRYSSGDTNYVMFADGSIEAQTPEGAMRFASLVELRRFVEQRH